MGTDTSQLAEQHQYTLAGLKLAEPYISVGIDVGQTTDPTTIVVAEALQRWSGRWQHIPEEFSRNGYRKAQDIPILETLFQVRFVSRIPLNTDYPVVALMLAALLDNKPLQRKKRIVRIDITGVGRPIYQMLVAEINRLPERRLIQCQPITFRHGDAYLKEKGVLGKAFGVSRAQALLQRSLIKVPGKFGPSPEDERIRAEVLAMIEEVKIYKIKVDENGMDKYGAFEAGTHDDLATALILCCLEDMLGNQITYGPKVR